MLPGDESARLTVGDVFAGIGGWSLGLERAGFEIAWQIELDAFRREVLAKQWPLALRRDDVRICDAYNLPWVHVLAGSFPCQDISSAHTGGERRGLDGPRSGLWRELRRVVADLQPRWVLVENSPEWTRWMPEVRADLAAYGYASVPLVVSAGSLGAQHSRPRGFVVAHADRDSESLRALDAEVARLCAMARLIPRPDPPADVGVADGVPRRMDRLHALGDALVPDMGELFGRAILSVEAIGNAPISR